ncbi:MAG: XRE family transcriptional regulator [Reyranella sp.]|nr:MAG: XRE family transcriptional regulator [Reyranella sp.]
MTPAQCRSARALLNWSQEDLEKASRIAKKTIADFEREVRSPHATTSDALQEALRSAGVIFIPENGGGAGVRLRLAMPRFARRYDDRENGLVQFWFDYKDTRHSGRITDAVLGNNALDRIGPAAVFDRDRARILLLAAEKVDRGDFTPDGCVLIGNISELPRIPWKD